MSSGPCVTTSDCLRITIEFTARVVADRYNQVIGDPSLQTESKISDSLQKPKKHWSKKRSRHEHEALLTITVGAQ